jgi:thiamine biosynthesis protein ThiI
MEKVLLLLSGGFDSAVAGKILQDQGYEIHTVHFSYEPFTGKEPQHKAEKLAQHLKFKKPIIINIGKKLKAISEKTEHKYYFVLTKRLMLKLAEKEAKKLKIKYLATGENLAQVSSQTLENLSVIDKVTKLTILKPLLAYEKQEIVDKAKVIGTYELSAGPETCDVLGPKHPTTRAEINQILDEEAKL